MCIEHFIAFLGIMVIMAEKLLSFWTYANMADKLIERKYRFREEKNFKSAR